MHAVTPSNMIPNENGHALVICWNDSAAGHRAPDIAAVRVRLVEGAGFEHVHITASSIYLKLKCPVRRGCPNVIDDHDDGAIESKSQTCVCVPVCSFDQK